MLGDIVLALPTIKREAKARRLGLADHVRHLVVHGVLHLLGFDHHRATEAARMERREIDILARLMIANPYRPPVRPRMGASARVAR
jgi:probable rRNA maturation factor